MVMQKLRDSAKIFLVILVLSFVGLIVFEWGMDITGIRQGANVLGEVNGEKIMADQFYQNLRNQIDFRRQQSNQELSEQEIGFIETQVWEGMVQDILMQQEIRKRGISASDSEVVSTIRNNPPEIVRNQDNFLTDGKFDMSKYRNALYDPRNDWLSVEQYVRAVIPYQKLQNFITASVFVTPEEVRWDYLKKNEKISANFIFFDPNKYPSDEFTIEEADIQTYYQENQEKYREDEKRKVDYAIFKVVPTERDSQAVMNDMDQLIERLKGGEDFATLAETYSEDQSTQGNGGDLGFFGRGSMVKPFEDAAYGAEIGEIVGPVVSQFGVHVIKVEAKKVENDEEKVEARHILLKFEPSNQTRSDVRTAATLFAMDALELGFAEAAGRDSVETATSAFFLPGGFIPGIGFSRDISDYVFANDTGSLREEPFETDQGFAVIRIAEIQKERIKPLEDVQTSIRSVLLTEKKREKAGQKAAEARKKMTVSENFESVAKEDSLEIKTAADIGRGSSVPSVGRDPSFMGSAFALSTGEISQPVEGTRGYYLIKLLDKKPVNEAEYEKERITIRQQLLDRKRQNAFANWYDDLKERAEIKDFRNRTS